MKKKSNRTNSKQENIRIPCCPVIHLKRKLRTILIQIGNKIREFCYEKVEKKIGFVIFDHNSSSVSAEFLKKPVKIVKKWLDYLLVGMFRDSRESRFFVILWEMAGNLPTAYFKVNARNSMVCWFWAKQLHSFLGPRHLIIRKVNIYYYTIQYCIGLWDLLDWPNSIEYCLSLGLDGRKFD